MRQLFVWTAVAVAPGMLYGQESRNARLQVGVIVRNESLASVEIVQEAETECAKAFKRGGVEIEWMNSAEDVLWYGPALVLRAAILPKAPKRLTVDILGSAFPFAPNGVQVLVYYDNVVARSWSVSLQPSRLLAAALEHEMGHMLLGSAEHAIGGVMHGHWNRQDLDYLSRGYLGFLPQEREQMRSHIRAVSQSPASRNHSIAVTSSRIP